MCALCGVLGGDGHWTDAAPRPGIFTRNTGPVERRRERMARVAGANRLLKAYGLSLADWQGAAYVLSTATGKSELVDSLAHLWLLAEKLAGRPCDPLDPGLIERLSREAGDG